jgi:hypothetical protein
VSCAFTLDHYGELLEAASAGGYRFATFDAPPGPGDLLLRHDVDLSLDAALRMAELEAEAGAIATYFLMTESVFYNLASPEGTEALARLWELGHRVGLHAVYPNAVLDERFDAVVAWHNPDPGYMTTPIDDAVNVMQRGWFDPATYRSDSNQHWSSGPEPSPCSSSSRTRRSGSTRAPRWERRCAPCWMPSASGGLPSSLRTESI